MSNTRRSAIYPGTFDPLTMGHVDLILRASKLFDRVVIAVARHSGKTPIFSTDERVQLIEDSVCDISNVEIVSFDGLLVHFMHTLKIKVMIRGLRAVSDFEYEFQLAGMNRHLDPEIETLFLTPAETYAYISSSLVRQIAELHGEISGFVPAPVKLALEERFGKAKQA